MPELYKPARLLPYLPLSGCVGRYIIPKAFDRREGAAAAKAVAEAAGKSGVAGILNNDSLRDRIEMRLCPGFLPYGLFFWAGT